jgi:hypothetical protein
MENKTESTRQPIQEPSWTPSPLSNATHCKLDWIEEVPFRSVRGVEVHSKEEEAARLHLPH